MYSETEKQSNIMLCQL